MGLYECTETSRSELLDDAVNAHRAFLDKVHQLGFTEEEANLAELLSHSSIEGPFWAVQQLRQAINVGSDPLIYVDYLREENNLGVKRAKYKELRLRLERQSLVKELEEHKEKITSSDDEERTVLIEGKLKENRREILEQTNLIDALAKRDQL